MSQENTCVGVSFFTEHLWWLLLQLDFSQCTQPIFHQYSTPVAFRVDRSETWVKNEIILSISKTKVIKKAVFTPYYLVFRKHSNQVKILAANAAKISNMGLTTLWISDITEFFFFDAVQFLLLQLGISMIEKRNTYCAKNILRFI